MEEPILTALRRIIRAIDLRSRRLVEESGLTGPQLMVLRAAARLSGSPIGAIAREVHLSQPTVTGILDRLERQGLIRRERGEPDRRIVLVTVTPEGGRVLRAAPSLLEDGFRTQLARLESWEQTQILATLQRLASMMGAEGLDASPVLATGPIDPAGEPATKKAGSRKAKPGERQAS
jgi:DNA-binding MarR family transcriptional regulator